ncbi:MAG: thermonuclease family protein [Coriobacteriia bacterium]|nr:thermonuclease family protein [Coriobacteriia bacterium]
MSTPRHVRSAILVSALLAACLALTGCVAEASVETAADPGVVAEATQTPSASVATSDFEPATVTRIIDGDTIDVRFGDGRIERVRFIGVDTPEDTTRHEPYGPEATAYATRTLADQNVYLEYDAERRDRYDRLLAYVWLEQPAGVSDATVRASLFNARLLLDGYAQLLTIPPNVAYADRFTSFQTEAREAGRGLWNLAAPQAPSSAQPAPTQGVVDWSDASDYVGQRVTVSGRVAGTHYASGANGQPTFLNIGRDHPDPDRFTVVIWGEDRSKFPSRPESMYAGKTLRVTGEVSLYRGTAQIVVDAPGQIVVVE